MRHAVLVTVLGLASATLIAIGCSGGDAPAPASAVVHPPTAPTGTPTPAAVGPTFYKDVLPILQGVCQNCHVQGGIGPFPLVTYDDAKAHAADIVVQTGNGTMPPWGAKTPTAECSPRFAYAGDLRLSATQIATLGDWLNAGTLEGNVKDAPPPATPLPAGLPGMQQELAPAAPFTLQGTSDQFRCFVLDPKLTATTYVNGTFIVAGNPEVVHHALVYTDPDAKSKALADPVTGAYDCFGGPGISNTTLLTAWAPGGVPLEYPSNAAASLSPGTLLVMQVHYHPQSAGAAAPDTTKFQMRFLPAAPVYTVYMALIGNFGSAVKNGTGLLPGPDDPATGPQFLIPANSSGHTETMQFTMPATISGYPTPTFYVYGAGSHMHWVGTDQLITMHRANPTATEPADECLLQEPKWDFYWQRGYNYDVPIEQLPTVSAGDVLTVRCKYDNTLANPRLATALMQQGLTAPHDVKLGETTLDEMCLGVFALLYQFP